MVPLHQEDDDPEIGQGPHQASTQFFALPKPRIPDEVTPLRKADPIATASQPVAAGPPPGMAHHGGMVPGMVPPGAVPPGHMQPMAPIGIQGPIAGGPVGGYSMPPGAQLPPDPSSEMHRAQSYRVFAIVIGLMFMVFTVLAVTVTLTVYGIYWYDKQPEQRDKDLTMAPVAPPPPVDTGTRVAPPPPPTPQPVQPKTPTGPKPPSQPRPPPEPAPATDPAAVSLTLQPGSPPFTSVEIKCPTGFRERGDFVGGKATVPNVPREDCEALFKGGPPAKTRVTGGDSKSCSFVGGNAANCR